MLSGVDVLVLLKVVAMGERKWNQSDLAYELAVSPSIVNRALKTAESLNLYNPSRKRVSVKQLEGALVQGARYFLAPKRGGEVRGMPTAWAGVPLVNEIASSDPLPPVWPDPMGEIRGLSVEPLHPNVPKAARIDPKLHELLTLLDTLRIGGPRESKLAEKALHERLNQK